MDSTENTTAITADDVTRMEQVSASDLQDWIDWMAGIQK